MKPVYVTAGAVMTCLLIASVGASAAPKNLVKNPAAELGAGAKNASTKVRVPGWRTTGDLTAVIYAAGGGFPDVAVAGKIGGGKKFFAGGPAAARSTATQTVSVAAPTMVKQIDRGALKATLAGYLGGYLGQADAARVDGVFRSGTGKKLGSLRIGPVTTAQRANATTLLARTTTGAVPKGTRSVDLVLTAIRRSGQYNDGYADNISLTLAPDESNPPPPGR